MALRGVPLIQTRTDQVANLLVQVSRAVTRTWAPRIGALRIKGDAWLHHISTSARQRMQGRTMWLTMASTAMFSNRAQLHTFLATCLGDSNALPQLPMPGALLPYLQQLLIRRAARRQLLHLHLESSRLRVLSNTQRRSLHQQRDGQGKRRV